MNERHELISNLWILDWSARQRWDPVCETGRGWAPCRRGGGPPAPASSCKGWGMRRPHFCSTGRGTSTQGSTFSIQGNYSRLKSIYFSPKWQTNFFRNPKNTSWVVKKFKSLYSLGKWILPLNLIARFITFKDSFSKISTPASRRWRGPLQTRWCWGGSRCCCPRSPAPRPPTRDEYCRGRR